MSVPHVHADDTIGNVLAIDLRLGQDSDLTSVWLANSLTATEVVIDAINLSAGTYTLILESFDRNGGVFSTLKTDIITVTIVAVTTVVKQTKIPDQVLVIISGEKTDWTLPKASSSEESAVVVKFDPFIASYLQFSEEKMTISYNGTVIEGLKDQVKMADILITYMNATSWETFVQRVIIYPQLEDSITDEGSEQSFDEQETPELTPV